VGVGIELENMTLLELKDIHFDYGETKAVRGLRLKLNEGEKLGIIGASGSGKSTLLKLIAAKLLPTKGRILYRGNDLSFIRNDRVAGFQDIAIMDQDFNLSPDLNVDDNILRYARSLTVTASKRYLSRVHRAFHLQSFKHKKIRFLSGGQKQRVALACALVSDAPLLVLDEPFSQLDYILKQELIAFVEQEAEGKTLIIVGHEPSDLMAICDRMIAMQSGRVVQDATVDEIYHNPKNEYVARLSGRCNILSGLTQDLLETGEKFLRPSHLMIGEGSEWVLERIFYYGYGRMGTFYSQKTEESIDVQLGNDQIYKLADSYNLSIKKPQR
jgi:ABC-type Fe3+/spermidine/putrescine transport system ATPase subunit